MDRSERFYRIDVLLKEHTLVSKQKFLTELGVSAATFKRDLAYMRDRFNAPIIFDAENDGYRFDQVNVGPQYALPGVWFNASEIHALLTMQQLLHELQPGLLSPQIKPILSRLNQLLDRASHPKDEVYKRIRLLRVNARSINQKVFDPVSTALLQRRQIEITHYHRARNTSQERVLSPQRLVYYRDNWYLDAWCHLREAMRSFSLDAIASTKLKTDAAIEISDDTLDQHFTQGYGIFSGVEVQLAVLRFSPERARWVSREQWHPQQESEFESSGHFVLKLPYTDDRELIMDILRHLPEVSVLEPLSLQQKIKEKLETSLALIKNS